MSPRALWVDGFDFFFYSKEENRRHIHVEKGENYAKIWLEPSIEISYNNGFNSREMRLILQIIKENERIINEKWDQHFHR